MNVLCRFIIYTTVVHGILRYTNVDVYPFAVYKRDACRFATLVNFVMKNAILLCKWT